MNNIPIYLIVALTHFGACACGYGLREALAGRRNRRYGRRRYR